MARKREFDPEVALDRAVQVFWHKGYGQTSIDDLVAATGVNRYGLYSAFGDKHALFVEVMHRYQRRVVDQRLSGLRRDDATVHDVLAFFEMFKLLGRQDAASWGCLICNAMTEMGAIDPDVQQAALRYGATFAKHFAAALSNSVKAGHLPADYDPELEAEHLTLLVVGMAVLFKGALGPERVDRTIDACVSGLRRALR